ncbi:MAG: hypothetical protein CVU51_03020 [Deltaproteobacteria bacterium HGW-Deltaproteobacteria-1]|jgi:hypothetical protein|nr:MAG: hypothetical protein CVU51_03020 [Deltaproteobacteria bacterium HGW-Deltaproteobacteria-1]
MTDEQSKQLKSIVDASGFVFQLSIMDNIQRTKDKHGWDILAHEHPWSNLSNGDEGFIDIILKQNRTRLVIECKRTKDACWVFINPDGKSDEIAPARCLWADIHQMRSTFNPVTRPVYEIVSGAYDFVVEPTSPESEFCAIRGSSEKDKPLLERICGKLLRAIDCLLIEEMEIMKKKEYQDASIYVPVIVTNAKLELCHFDPEKVSLKDGFLSDVQFETVPFIRFRKSLTTALSSSASPSSITDASKDRERTILVINADSLCGILENMKVKLPPYTEAYPWR